MHLRGCNRIWQLLVGSVLLGRLVSSTAVDEGKLATVNGINYYVGASALSKVESSVPINGTDSTDIRPLTVIRTSASTFTPHMLQKKIDNFTASDDVFQSGFLECGLLPDESSAFYLHSPSYLFPV